VFQHRQRRLERGDPLGRPVVVLAVGRAAGRAVGGAWWPAALFAKITACVG
jgi:hypothetical protein